MTPPNAITPRVEVLTLRRLAPVACARIGAGVGLVLGALLGVLLALAAPVVTTLWSDFSELQAGVVAASLVLVPIGSTAVGAVAGAAFGLVFNGVARWTGGLRIVVEHPLTRSAPPPAVPDEASW